MGAIIYWRNRKIANVTFSLIFAAILACGDKLGLHTVFDGKGSTFQKGCELALTVSTSLLGFLIAAIALIFTMVEGERLSVLKQSRSFTALIDLSSESIFWLITTAVFGAFGILFSFDEFTPMWLAVFRIVMLFSALQAFLATSAITWVLLRLTRIR